MIQRIRRRYIKAFIIGLIYVLFMQCFALPVMAQESDTVPYVVTLYNEQNGLPTGEANTVLQTVDGHIWIGSYGGLIRYDGTEFRNYSVEQAITSNSIRSLFQDSQGRLWIGTNDAGVVMMENDIFTEIESPRDKTFLCIRDFAEGADGTIYVASTSGMAEIKDGKLQPYIVPEVAGETVYSVAVDSYGRVWGSMDEGKCVIVQDGDVLEVFESDSIFDGIDIYSIDADEAGNIVMGTSGNIVAIVSFPSESLKASDIIVKTHKTGAVNVHNTIESAKGYILVSGINGFAVISPKGELTEFGEKDKAMSVNAAIADYENNLWLASSSYGIIKYSQGCFDTPNRQAALENITINTITYQKGYWYIGTDTGLVVCDDEWNRVTNSLTEMFEGIRIRNIIADSKGNVWLASYSNNPVVCYESADNSIVCYNDENGLNGDKARVIMELSDGSVAAGTQMGVYIIEDGKVIKSYNQEDGMDNTTVLCFAQGEAGELLVGSDGGGIYVIKDDEVTNYSFEEGLGEGVVLRMLKDSDNAGYFVSAGSSLYYWENGQFRRLSNFTKDAGSIFDFYDKDGKLWILQNSGIIAMDKATLLGGTKADTIHYSFNHGLTGSLNANTWNYMTKDSQLYIATRNGISVFGFKGVRNTVPRVCISRVIVDGQVYEHPEEIVLSSDVQRITIEFATLSFTDTIELRVETCLKGFDKVAALASEKSGGVSYTNLPGGEYVFEINVYSPEEGGNVTVTLPIIKEKKLVEYPLFWVALVAALFFAGSGIVMVFAKVKLQNMHRRQQEYRNIIEQSLKTFAKTIDAKDKYTNGHSLRVAEYSRELARRLGMSKQEQENIYYIALLHDIGKIGVPDNILNKPGKLTDEELQIIRQHVTIGGEILKDFTALEGITDGARFHHERFDGKGYNEGLSGLDIPKVARIIGVADSYDAMSSNRCYRHALPREIIEEELLKYSGTQFDPEVVPHMMAMIAEGMVPVHTEE